MVDIKSKRCQHPGCQTQPNYNYANESTAIFCSSHKLENMVDIKSKRCEHPGCQKQPAYNYPGETKAIFCSSHKLENMVDIQNKRCQHPGCQKHPVYNYPGETKAIFCSSHKLENMIDIKSKRCEHPGCQTIPNYNYPGESTAIFCSSHKLENMVDIKNKKCKSNDICMGTRANVKYKGYCARCYQHLFPNDPLSFQIRSKTKEIAVRDYINSIFEGFQHDIPLWTGNCYCTHRRRIDHRKLIGNTLLCIETDENQHKNYDKADEEIRYDDLMMLHGGKFVYIRFNPDKYKDKNGKSMNPMLYTRLPVLRKEIEKQINRIQNEENTELLEIIKLYYNE
jgi:Rieske Fe-S protein